MTARDVPTVAVPADLLYRLMMGCHLIPVLYEVDDGYGIHTQESMDAGAVNELMQEQIPEWIGEHDSELLDQWFEDPCRASHVAIALGQFIVVEDRPEEAGSILGEDR